MSGPLRVVLETPGIPSSLNVWTRLHWTTRNREREEWADRLRALMLAKGLRSANPFYRCQCRVILTYRVRARKHRQRYDLDNLAPKHILDALRGWVYPDDGPSFIGELIQRAVYDWPGDDSTLVEVEPMDYPREV